MASASEVVDSQFHDCLLRSGQACRLSPQDMVQFPERGLSPRLSRYLIMGTVLAALVLYARAEPEW